MARYIDADEIRWVDHYDSDGNLSKYKIAYSDEMPPAADVVPVVRCRDCKHNPLETWFDCPLSHLKYDGERWCWKGERKDGDGNG